MELWVVSHLLWERSVVFLTVREDEVTESFGVLETQCVEKDQDVENVLTVVMAWQRLMD